MANQSKPTSQSKGSSVQVRSAPEQNHNSTEHSNGNGQSPASGEAASAIELLKADHRKVEELFAQYKGLSDASQKENLAHQICQELMIHTQLEEEIFYKRCRENEVEDDMLDEAQVEHDGAKILIAELMTLSPESDFYDAKVKVLSEYIKHHVQEEEKDDGIFAKAEETDMDMEAIGQQIQQRKQELMTKAKSGRLRLPEPRALFSLMSPSHQENHSMARMGGRDRDEYGRFMSDDDDFRRGTGGRGQSASNRRERDEQGRFMSDDNDYRRGRSGGSDYREHDEQGKFMSDDDYRRGHSGGSDYRERDNQGRFMSDDDRGYPSRFSRSRYENEDDRRYSSPSRSEGGYRDFEGHTQASQRDWEDRGSRSPRHMQDEDDRRYSHSGTGGRNQSHGGWFGDSEGHSQAAQRGWEERGHSRSTRYSDQDDDRRYSSRGSNGGRGSHEHGGWYGDPRGHSQAARRGWENRD